MYYEVILEFWFENNYTSVFLHSAGLVQSSYLQKNKSQVIFLLRVEQVRMHYRPVKKCKSYFFGDMTEYICTIVRNSIIVWLDSKKTFKQTFVLPNTTRIKLV